MANIFIRFISIFFIILASVSAENSSTLMYEIKLVGLEEFPEIEAASKTLSQLINPDSDFSPGSEGILRDILQDDINHITDYLKSYGFHDVLIFPEIDTSAAPNYKIVIHVDSGERYTINRIKVFVNGKKFPIPTEILAARKNAPVINELILKDKNTIALYLKQKGYAFVDTLDELVTINHAALFANITYSYTTGPKGKFGAYTIAGLKNVKQDYVEKFIRWKAGDTYNIDHINETESLLKETGLFESVLITPANPTEANEFPLNINLTEGKPKHLQFNLYGNIALSSSETNRYEIGIIPKFTHNNIAGANEKFEINTILSNIVQDLNIFIKKPHFIFFNTNGRLFFSGERRTYEAYSRLGIDGGLGLEYNITKNIEINLGLLYEKYSLERQTDLKKNSYDFFGTPFNLRIDSREDKIFSDFGTQIEATWTPFFNSENTLQSFSIKGSIYLPIINNGLILASWARWSALYGISFDESPMDKRLYLGGSQDLRGYNKNSIGNMDPLHNNPEKFVPRGGLSSIAIGIEPRFKIYGSLWAACFLEGGQISEEENVFKGIHKFSDLYWDGGVSIFYFMGFGPLRIDIAYPLGDLLPEDKKEFKFYISFGQAF
ncbi:MAG: BamA/TamA family outer membrane protein [Candidatus Paracaedibacteraceae bacterium]|nr:BamA/TamA family outer membrane protein [Candidatus Paracaedibacteraceae bacterium]